MKRGPAKRGSRSERETLLDGAVNRPSLRRLCRRGGVKRISGSLKARVQADVEGVLEQILRRTVALVEHSKRKTVSVADVVNALRGPTGSESYRLNAFYPATPAAERRSVHRGGKRRASEASGGSRRGSPQPRSDVSLQHLVDVRSPNRAEEEVEEEDLEERAAPATCVGGTISMKFRLPARPSRRTTVPVSARIKGASHRAKSLGAPAGNPVLRSSPVNGRVSKSGSLEGRKRLREKRRSVTVKVVPRRPAGWTGRKASRPVSRGPFGRSAAGGRGVYFEHMSKEAAAAGRELEEASTSGCPARVRSMQSLLAEAVATEAARGGAAFRPDQADEWTGVLQTAVPEVDRAAWVLPGWDFAKREAVVRGFLELSADRQNYVLYRASATPSSYAPNPYDQIIDGRATIEGEAVTGYIKLLRRSCGAGDAGFDYVPTDLENLVVERSYSLSPEQRLTAIRSFESGRKVVAAYAVGFHWHLAVYEGANLRIYDSLRMDNAGNLDPQARRARRLYSRLTGREFGGEISGERPVKQRDGSSCGMWVCMIARNVLMGERYRVPLDAKRTTFYRYMMAYELLMNRLATREEVAAALSRPKGPQRTEGKKK